jgi:HSP20 family molecular chaperone IbpA
MDPNKQIKFNNVVSYAVNKLQKESSNCVDKYSTQDMCIDSADWTWKDYNTPEWDKNFVGDIVPSITVGDYPMAIKPNTGGWVSNPGIINTIDTSSIDPVSRKIEELQERLNKIEDTPNKIDSDLVKGKLPYNIKTDIDENLYYEFAIAGYNAKQIKISRSKEGLEVKLLGEEDDDFIGDLYEYVCKGIKNGNQSVYLYIDSSQYDLDNIESSIKNGILLITIKHSKKKIIKIKELD